jgi:hypothetical protein
MVMITIVALAAVAVADKPVIESDGAPAPRIDCGLNDVVYDWDFAQGDQGFTTMMCDDEGEAVWQYGVDDAYGTVWGTILNGDYLNNSGEALVSPTFMVDATTQLVEVYHFYATENVFDGLNLAVNGTVVEPVAGYDVAELNTSSSYYAWCVDGEPGYTDDLNPDFITSCWDLSAFLGQDVALEFTFGSDSSVTYPGWYIASVKVGSAVVAVESATFSEIKALYQ